MTIALAAPEPDPLRRLQAWWATQAKAPRLRTMGAFAEQEIILPDGPYKGQRYRMDRLPWARHWFAGVGTGDQWQRYALTGTTQGGKSLNGTVIPVQYHLFEVGETVGFGLPDLSMANDKWSEDLLPAIESSRYREYLPTHGPGSRSGRIKDAVYFRNGVTLRFFTGGGGDKSRAAYTTRVMVITEVDGMDVVGGGSKESDKVSQLEARTLAYGERRRIYMECTVSTDTGRITLERKGGTDSRLVCPCPYCSEYVTPEREHLIGWQDATTEQEAKRLAAFACPACGHVLTELDRVRMNHESQLIHRGQSVDMGWVVGTPEPTDTFSMRFSAFNNLFMPVGEIGKKEWAKVHGPPDKEEERERELRQFFHCIPVEQSKTPVISLETDAICQRTTNDKRGILPVGTEYLSVGVDIHKWRINWCLVAFREGASPHVVDYGILPVPTDQMGEERAILNTLREFRDQFCQPGWPDQNGETKRPDRILVDCRYQGEKDDVYPVYDFCVESRGWVFPSMGWGVGTYGTGGEYKAPAKVTDTIVGIGEHYHVIRSVKSGRLVWIVYVDVDHWKGWAHKRIITPVGQPGALTLFSVGRPVEHLLFAKHITAERQEEEFVPGKGLQIKWAKLRSDNHFLDALMNACVGGHFAGARLVVAETRQESVEDYPSREDSRERKWKIGR
jgi:hypothetical protein